VRGAASAALGLAIGLLACAVCACASSAPPPPAPGAEQPAAEDARFHYYDETEVDVPARPVDPIEPAYPPQLRALGVEGEVEARVVVLADGTVGGAKLSRSTDDAFTGAVREALAHARFHPARRAGRPVASWVTLRLKFRLEEGAR
jgi:protein TonB